MYIKKKLYKRNKNKYIIKKKITNIDLLYKKEKGKAYNKQNIKNKI
jgi:hypothetical protein